MLEIGEEALGVEGRRAAGAGRGDGLTVGVVDEVAGGEDAPKVGGGAPGLDEDVALPAEGHLEQLAGAAADHRAQPAGVDPDVHRDAGGPQDDGLGVGEGRRGGDVERDGVALGRDGDVAPATGN